MAKTEELKITNGVFIQGLANDGAAKQAGIEPGDVVVSVNKVKVNSVAELQSQIGRFNPGDEVLVGVNRDGVSKEFSLNLRNSDGNTDVVKLKDQIFTKLGGQLNDLTDEQKTELGLESGVIVSNLHSGSLQSSGVRNQFIITHVDNQPVKDVESLTKVLKSKSGGILLSGIYPNGSVKHYGVGL